MSEPVRGMVDIETLGTEPGCVILSIGAVRFDSDGPDEEFSTSVSMTDCQREGLSIDAETLEWWLSQDPAAQEQLLDGAELEQALLALRSILSGADEVWANSPAFDLDILEAAYAAVDLEPPWDYWDRRDYRTLKKLQIAPSLEQEGLKHDALDDARYQAKVAAEALSTLNALLAHGDEDSTADGGAGE